MYSRIVYDQARVLHRRLRDEKVREFFRSMSPQESESLLDVGGTVGIHNEFAELHGFFSDTTLLNLTDSAMKRVPNVRLLCGDARAIPLPDKSVDWVFSNAVIEHVGDEADQLAMAAEIGRVARKGFFVSTPNRWFPLDPHTYLPLVHYFVRDYTKASYRCRLLAARDMRKLFPAARVEYFSLWTSVTAYQRFESAQSLEVLDRFSENSSMHATSASGASSG
jgi:ubiquinone/menaquinone biosynthesis C-methylase UbiE